MKKICLIFALALAACVQSENSGIEINEAKTEISEDKTKEVLDHHWIAFGNNDLEETMKDYSEESVLITPNATYSGLEEIRNNFINAFKAFPKDSTTFSLDKSIVVKDVGYILWTAKTPTFTLTYATDTFIIRDGKIFSQTYAGAAQ